MIIRIRYRQPFTFAPNNINYTDGTNVNEQYGIGGSLQRRETNIPGNQPNEELYRFGADGNLRLYSYDRLFYSLYGYDGGTTRTYKYSFDLNPNWVNGRLESVNFNMRNAMFYPNSYLNFNQDGHYTKHYYNGMERIASRLGDRNISINVNDPELQDRKDWQDSLIRKNIVDITGYDFLPVGEEQNHEDPKPIYELPQVGITGLQPIGSGDVFYYHTNHLGSTCYVTDGNASVQQGFLYAPFGEITNEYNNSFGSSIIPKYSFNAKELDEETGMYYYEARYYQPPVFTSRDRLFEKYPTFSPYTYCANNPVKYIDPSGDSVKIMGDAADLATSQLSSRGMKIFRDNKTGFIGYTLTGKKLTNSDRQMIDAIDSKKVNVNIYATTASKFNFEDITLSNNSFGQFLGVTVSDCLSKNNSDRTAETYQLVNPYLGEIADNKYDVNLGTSLRHEITESYQAGLICIDEGISCGPCWRTWENHVIGLYDHVYYRAHKRATPQPDMLAEKRREAYNTFIKKLNLPMHLINRL